MNIKTLFLYSSMFLFSLLSCGQKTRNGVNEVKNATSSYEKASPDFNADSAYSYIETQAGFGPRVPNTEAHKRCGDYLSAQLKQFGAKVYEQEAILTAYDGTKLQARNIIGSYDSDNKNRILLFAHWDSRPYADEDPDEANHHTPILGVDDGASGVGVLLEIARQLQQTPLAYGIDIIFFDAEDYGIPTFVQDYKEDTWCLGSQYWSKNPHIKNYQAKYGILLDMVGSKGAVFYKEYFSMKYAAPIVEKIWNTATKLGHQNYFKMRQSGSIVDDHLYVNTIRRIPSANIVNTDLDRESGFAHYWHTINDTMDNIDKTTLQAVGQTVLEVIYAE